MSTVVCLCLPSHVCVKRLVVEIISYGDAIHTHDLGSQGIRGAEWASKASMFARTAFGHKMGDSRDECLWPQL